MLTTSKKKSTCGLLCTKNLTGCRSMITLTVKSWGVPGLTVFLGMALWCEWMSVSSRSSTNVFRCTILRRCRETGDSGNNSYLTGWYWTNWSGSYQCFFFFLFSMLCINVSLYVCVCGYVSVCELLFLEKYNYFV